MDNPADRVETVATYDDLPELGDPINAYFVEDEDLFYQWDSHEWRISG